MKVLVFRHVPFEGLGHIASSLEERGIGFEYADLYSPGAPVPEIAAYDGLIVMGGPMSANDPLPFLEQEVCCIRHAMGRRQPILGVCLGSQLIARAMGATIRRNPVTELGWFDLHFTEAAASDRLFAGLSEPETTFHWHSDTWDLPPSGVLLAGSDACAHQAFRIGSNVYGLQFHVEVTPEMIEDWLRQDVNCGDVRQLNSPIEPHFNKIGQETLAKVLFGRWASLL